MTVDLRHGDCLTVLATLPDASVDAVVTDPPYGLEFMGKAWDAPWSESDVNADAGFKGGGVSATRNAPSFTGSTNPKCLRCKGTRRGRRDGTAKVAVCLCEDGGHFPNVRAVEMRAFAEWCETWAVECYRVLKPGGHILAFGGTRTWHRLTCAIEDSGFEIRDSIAWMYGSGFPKSLNVAKAITGTQLGHGGNSGAIRRATMGDNYTESGRRGNRDGAGRRDTGLNDHALDLTPEAQAWQGWGTALKPAFEPVVVARKPLAGTVASNVLAHGTGALNIDGCRTAVSEADREAVRGREYVAPADRTAYSGFGDDGTRKPIAYAPAGRWPANVVLDESQAEVLDAMSGTLTSGANPTRRGSDKFRDAYGDFAGQEECVAHRGADSGGASRFFYVAKAPADERVRVNGTAHPTVKPLALMRWLVRLVTPPGGKVLDPFAGSGTTGEACLLEDFDCVLIEREADYLPLIRQRIARRRDPVEAVKAQGEDGGLFDLLGGESA